MYQVNMMAVEAATSIFIPGDDWAISSAQKGNSGKVSMSSLSLENKCTFQNKSPD